MEADDQRSRNRDRTSRSQVGSSRSSPPRSAQPLTRPDRDRGHEAVSSSSESQELERINLFLEQSSSSFTAEQRNVVDLCVAVIKKDIVRATKLVKVLQAIDIDKAWKELAEIYKSKYPEAEKLAGPLHHAAHSGYKPMCKLIITQGQCDVNAATSDGTTPLMFALYREGNQAIVQYLSNKHADLNKANDSGTTPLHIAATKGYYEIAEYLLLNGANVDPLRENGESPLFCAALLANERMVALLLKHNADYNRLSKKLLTPLLASLHASSLNCLKILIEVGADVNGVGCSLPPVVLAAYKGLDDCIQCLLLNGANPNVPDEDNNIPIQIAAAEGWERCVEILLPHSRLTQYEGLSLSQIVEFEKTVLQDRFRRSSRAIEQGDAAYWRKEHDIALRFYTEAAQIAHKDPTLFAKRSLCYLYLHAQAKFIEEAINYMNMVQPNLSTLDPETAARKLVMDFARAWKEPGSASSVGSGRSPTDKTSSGENQ